MAELKIPRSKLRTVPPPNDIGPNADPKATTPVAERHLPSLSQAPASGAEKEPYRRIDGRSLRRTGRTVPFGTRVSQDYDRRLREAAQRDGISLAEVLERSLDLYEKQQASC